MPMWIMRRPLHSALTVFSCSGLHAAFEVFEILREIAARLEPHPDATMLLTAVSETRTERTRGSFTYRFMGPSCLSRAGDILKPRWRGVPSSAGDFARNPIALSGEPVQRKARQSELPDGNR
jgi:hypothetical protein